MKVNTRLDGLMIIWSRFSWFSHQTPYGDNWTWLAVDRKCCETPSPPSRPSPLKRVEKVAETGKGPLAGDSFTPLSLIKLMSCFCSHVFKPFRAHHWPLIPGITHTMVKLSVLRSYCQLIKKNLMAVCSAFFKIINHWSRHISLSFWFAHLKLDNSPICCQSSWDHLVSPDVSPKNQVFLFS